MQRLLALTLKTMLAAVVLFIASATVGATFAAPMTKAQIEAVVRDYIASHGDELRASLDKAERKARMAEANKLIGANTPVYGAAGAPVTIIEFSDFQCPFCGRVQETIKALRTKYGNNVRWAYKHLPLEFHPGAKPAAYASYAAHKQGKFWEYSKALWANQDKVGNDAFLVDAAKKLKLDMKRFEADRTSAAAKALVEADDKQGQDMGASGTPFFIINGRTLSGAMPQEAFEKLIDAELKRTR